MTEKDRLEVYETRRRLGFSDPVSFRMAEDTDLDEAAAWDELAEHTENNLKHQEMQRPLQALNGSSGIPDTGSQDPSVQAEGKAGDDEDEMSMRGVAAA
jgi:hypothetical protein